MKSSIDNHCVKKDRLENYRLGMDHGVQTWESVAMQAPSSTVS